MPRGAYPDTRADRVEEYAAQYFLSGLHDAEVKSGVSGLPLTTMAETLEACRRARSRLGEAPPHSGTKPEKGGHK